MKCRVSKCVFLITCSDGKSLTILFVDIDFAKNAFAVYVGRQSRRLSRTPMVSCDQMGGLVVALPPFTIKKRPALARISWYGVCNPSMIAPSLRGFCE
jgi:hypothetical protein